MSDETARLTAEIARLSDLVRTAVDMHKSFFDGRSASNVLHCPPGAWPARMNAQTAAAYVGETSAAAFLKRVGPEYPLPAIDRGIGKGRRRLWLKRELDQAIGNLVEGKDVPEPF